MNLHLICVFLEILFGGELACLRGQILREELFPKGPWLLLVTIKCPSTRTLAYACQILTMQ